MKMEFADLLKIMCSIFACTGIGEGFHTKSGTPVPATPKTSSKHTINVNVNISIDFPNSSNTPTVPQAVNNPIQNKPSAPNDTSNSTNSSVPNCDPEDTEKPNSNGSEPILPAQAKTAVENDLSWVVKHPSWVHLTEPRNAACGESVSTDRIIGGTNAALGQHPWIARLGRFKYFNGKVKGNVDWYCAGTVISKMYVLSAGHCTHDKNFRIIRLGEYDTNSNVDCNLYGCAAPAQDFTPQDIITHKDYVKNKVISPHDISLIRLDSVINFNGWVAPICLPYFNDPKLFQGNSETIGWGLTVPLVPSYSATLQTVQLPIISEEECREKVYKSLGSGTFCAGGVKGEDSCNGDSGGPLLKVNDHDGFPRYYGIGIVSFGPAHCGNGISGAYTNISSHMHWILSNIKHP